MSNILNIGTFNFHGLHKKLVASGSTCGAAIGVGKYKSREALKREKLGDGERIISAYEQSILDYGITYEKSAIKLVNQCQWHVDPSPFFFLLDDHRFGATPDGLITYPAYEAVLEVKCPIGQKIYEELEQGYVPIEHFCQVMMEMACSQRNYGLYVCWTPNQACFAEVVFDMDVWSDIYARLLVFAEILEHDLDGKFLKGQKQIIKDRYIAHSKKLTRILYLIEPAEGTNLY